MPFPPIEVFFVAVMAGLAGGAITTSVFGGRLSSNAISGVVVVVLVATLIHA